MTLDDLRAAMPDLGFALYAYVPGGPVTLEIHAEEGVFTFSGPTEAAAVAAAIPQTEEPADDSPTVVHPSEPEEDIFG
jgi:hypothetical protein